jgi:hypothetical protein
VSAMRIAKVAIALPFQTRAGRYCAQQVRRSNSLRTPSLSVGSNGINFSDAGNVIPVPVYWYSFVVKSLAAAVR